MMSIIQPPSMCHTHPILRLFRFLSFFLLDSANSPPALPNCSLFLQVVSPVPMSNAFSVSQFPISVTAPVPGIADISQVQVLASGAYQGPDNLDNQGQGIFS